MNSFQKRLATEKAIWFLENINQFLTDDKEKTKEEIIDRCAHIAKLIKNL